MHSRVSSFPVEGLLPKEELGAQAFVDKNPKWDGRGVVIAILDTGVDPGAPGLQVTPDGRPKVIDCIDCTGSGDVAMSTIVTAQESDGLKSVNGISGRKLILNSSWKNPSGSWKLGVKAAYDVFPKPLVDRLKESRKKRFELDHHALLVSAEQESIDFEKAHPGPSEDVETKLDLKARVEVLRDQFKSFEESGWLLDCIVWHDGSKWRAVVDVDESGDVSSQTPLSNFADERQFVKIDTESQLNFSVNIYDEGEILSIVSLAGSHGTHVAGISAAYYPDDPLAGGVAPGAQIVSLKIGDTRLGSMETGAGFTRAAIELCRLKCDLANISYGEPAAIANFGKVVELLRDEVINKSGCIIVSSAGNEGPCLTTVGAPGGTTATILAVGAYVTKSMMQAEYSMLETVAETPYTWSSRGPTVDGAVGVDIYAPGAAITTVPQYNLYGSQLMNGTSMSSPSMCGGVALLVSALKANGIPYTPYRVKAALVNTSKDIGDPQKVGFAQIIPAWEYLKATSNYQLDVYYETSILERGNARGVYLREPEETTSVSQYTVQIQPVFSNKEDPSSAEAKLKLEVRMTFKSDVPWISTPEFLLLNSGGRTFAIKVDPTSLKPGLHVGRINGYDTSRPEAGVLVSIPVTIVKPISVDAQSPTKDGAFFVRYLDLDFIPGTIERRFIAVPNDANFADVTFRSENRETSGRFMVDCKQLVPQTRHNRFNKDWMFSFGTTNSGSSTEHNVQTKTFAVQPGVTMELCIAQFWSSLGKTRLSVEIKFHGIYLSTSSNVGGNASTQGSGVLWLNSGNHGFSRLEVRAPIRKEDVQISISLDTLQKSIRPDSCVISPLKSRDVLPDSRQIHQAILTYIFKAPEGGGSVTPRFPRLNEVLYDSVFEGFFGLIYDANKRVVSSQDIYPKVIKATDGTYTYRAQLMSRSVDLLDRISNMPMILDIAITKPISLSIYPTLGDLMAGSSEGFKKKTLEAGGKTFCWVLAADGLPKDSKPGDLVVGKVELGQKIEGTLFSAVYIVPSEVKPPAPAPTTGADEPSKDDQTLMKEEIRDLQINYLKKLPEEARKEVLAKLEQDYPTHLPLLVARLEILADKEQALIKANTPVPQELGQEIVLSADKVLERVNIKELAMWFGVKHDLTLKPEIAKNKEMGKAKESAIYALQWKATGFRDIVQARETASPSTSAADDALIAFDAAMVEYMQWLPDPATSDGKYLLLWVWRQRKKGRLGSSIKAINKFLGESKNVSDANYSKCLDIKKSLLVDLGWRAWQKYEERKLNPTDWAPF
ncbi:hypothetical protein SmJEL517_g02335 [Synchytrium microbalum]|uniref:Tripeptidyl-peptidase 2 n=1 Tax=Synchytrium microbalum TaxID=1806994 RepID=A0A507CBC8_9FUNG|nr:uncharacterized protein SmJEL517_g02335 [Synchytrium microbalum]TPX35306.1 hypothetical protein SmJEL517_g02335 [Synchytrium microbalum]